MLVTIYYYVILDVGEDCVRSENGSIHQDRENSENKSWISSWTVDSREDREEGCLFMHELQSSSETNLFFFFPSPFWTNEAAEKMENRQIDGDTD